MIDVHNVTSLRLRDWKDYRCQLGDEGREVCSRVNLRRKDDGSELHAANQDFTAVFTARRTFLNIQLGADRADLAVTRNSDSGDRLLLPRT